MGLLIELRNEIKRLNKVLQGDNLTWGNKAKLEGIKQTVKAVDMFVSPYEKTEPKVWSEIKKLLKIKNW